MMLLLARDALPTENSGTNQISPPDGGKPAETHNFAWHYLKVLKQVKLKFDVLRTIIWNFRVLGAIYSG